MNGKDFYICICFIYIDRYVICKYVIQIYIYKHINIYIYIYIKCAHEKGHPTTCKNMVGTWGPYVKWDKSDKDKYSIISLK